MLNRLTKTRIVFVDAIRFLDNYDNRERCTQAQMDFISGDLLKLLALTRYFRRMRKSRKIQ